MALTPSGLAPAVGRAARWASRLLSAAAGKFGLLVAWLVALMGAAPLIPGRRRVTPCSRSSPGPCWWRASTRPGRVGSRW